MRKKAVWLILSCLIVTALVLASCGPAVEEEGEGKTVIGKVTEKEEAVVEEEEEVVEGKDMVTLTLTKRDGTTMQVTKERPRYGGMITMTANSPMFFDDIYGLNYGSPWKFTQEGLEDGKWELGPSGTGDFSWMYNLAPPPLDSMGGGGATESWELVDPDTMVFHIRKGMYFHNKPPTNGREMDANDVEFSIKRVWNSPQSYLRSGRPWDEYIEHITALDKWTLEIKCKPGKAMAVYATLTGVVYIVPHEVIDEYGNMNDWENTCGTGPFLLVDFLDASSATYERNPNYWMDDPLFPENRLPYVDGLKELYITDRSTINAAVRTGKVDSSSTSYWEDAEALLQSNPELNQVEYLTAIGSTIDMKQDNPELPWYDKRVRQALMMAIDHQAIKDSFYGGHAKILAWPVLPVPDVDLFGDMYQPLESLPESTRKLYEYHPEEAKALLAEAGYPDGFKAELVCMAQTADLMTVVQADWAKIGVDLELQIKEVGAWYATAWGRAFKHMIWGTVDSTVEFSAWARLAAETAQNFGNINDPIIEEARLAGERAGFDERARTLPMKEIFPYILEQAYKITLCSYTTSVLWQPWLKGYSGETFCGSLDTYKKFTKFAWIDQDLKFDMTGQR